MRASPRSKVQPLKRISVPRSYDVLATSLRESILGGDLVEGALLPTEREMVTQTGLSRGSVREALRMLEVEGLVESRRGRQGGNVVTLPGNDSMASAVDRFVRGRKLSMTTLNQTREAIEPTLARLAAEHRSEQDLLILAALHQELIAAAGNMERFSLVNVKWHNAVAIASRNELLAGFLYSISYGVAMSTMTEEYDTPENHQDVIRIHSMINAAIASGQADLAEKRMRQHIGATQSKARAPTRRRISL